MSRIPGWHTALAAEFRTAQRTAFRWGQHDCFQFVAKCALAIRGEEFRRFFASYDCEAEALGIIWARGGMANMLTEAFGKPKPVAFAGVGDAVLVDMGRGLQPAISMGLNCYAPGARRLVSRPTASATAAWTI